MSGGGDRPRACGGSGDVSRSPAAGGFEVHLDVFEGPFDLLLALISKHKLDITEIALSSVTDEFISYIRALADGWDLDQASYFLVVAATLLDLKAARLLPAGEVDDEEDLALLEARDLLFARLLQYRAYKEAAAALARAMTSQGRRFARRVPMEPRFAELLPEVLLGLGPAEFAAIAARTLAPKPSPVVSTAHLHVPRTTVREQAEILAGRLAKLRRATFRLLTSDCEDTYEVVARFLAILELYRDGHISFDQVAPLGDLYVTWAADGAAASGDLPARPDADQPSGEPASESARPDSDQPSGERDRRAAGQRGRPSAAEHTAAATAMQEEDD
jgi:segregation and condensation protein A